MGVDSEASCHLDSQRSATTRKFGGIDGLICQELPAAQRTQSLAAGGNFLSGVKRWHNSMLFCNYLACARLSVRNPDSSDLVPIEGPYLSRSS